jgi:hypothetical protein
MDPQNPIQPLMMKIIPRDGTPIVRNDMRVSLVPIIPGKPRIVLILERWSTAFPASSDLVGRGLLKVIHRINLMIAKATKMDAPALTTRINASQSGSRLGGVNVSDGTWDATDDCPMPPPTAPVPLLELFAVILGFTFEDVSWVRRLDFSVLHRAKRCCDHVYLKHHMDNHPH